MSRPIISEMFLTRAFPFWLVWHPLSICRLPSPATPRLEGNHDRNVHHHTSTAITTPDSEPDAANFSPIVDIA